MISTTLTLLHTDLSQSHLNSTPGLKIVLCALVIVLLIGASLAYAQSILSEHPQADFKSGYDHGVADASDPCNNDARITCNGPAYVWQSPP